MAGTSIDRLIQEALAEERKLKASFEQRAAFVISSSGGLSTLLLALAAISTGSEQFELPVGARVMLVVAVFLFAISALLCLKVNQPTQHAESSVTGLMALLENVEMWKASEVVGLRTVSRNRIDILGSFRSANAKKGEYLRWAIGAEVVAVMAVSLSVVTVLMSSSQP